MTISYLPVPWDSDFFGFKVGRIVTPTIKISELEVLLSKFKLVGFRLVYLIISPSPDNNYMLAPDYLPIDIKITYKFVYKKNSTQRQHTKYGIEEYLSPDPAPELMDLALAAGAYSRFKLDPNFAPGKYESLYSTWLKKSLDKRMASHTFVFRDNTKIAGFITLKISGESGTIGLIAVDARYRGKGIGRALINSTIEFLGEKGIPVCFVATQLANSEACKLYESCGFVANLSETYYHIWL